MCSETRAATVTCILHNGAKLITSRGDSRADGVAILMHQRYVHDIARAERFGGRLMYVDVRLLHSTIRFISISCPHAGYSTADLQILYDQLHMALDDARRHSLHFTIGGDFNTVLGLGVRGDMLKETIDNHDLKVTNHPADLALDERWTFKSCLGDKRLIDYILCSGSICSAAGRATDFLDLGSDPRAVAAYICRSKSKKQAQNQNQTGLVCIRVLRPFGCGAMLARSWAILRVFERHSPPRGSFPHTVRQGQLLPETLGFRICAQLGGTTQAMPKLRRMMTFVKTDFAGDSTAQPCIRDSEGRQYLGSISGPTSTP